MKHRLLLIAPPGSYRIAAYIQAAKLLNITILIGSTGEHSLITEVHDGLHLDFDDIDKSLISITQEHEQQAFSGIIGSDDSTIEFATIAAQHLNLIHNPLDSAKLTQRKDLARACLLEKNCVVPWHKTIDVTVKSDKQLKSQLEGSPWPCVVKPLNMSASRGVIRVDTLTDAITACRRVEKIIAPQSTSSTNTTTLKNDIEHSHILLEQYIEGEEVAFEGFMQNGVLQQIALFDKPNPLTGPYFEETIYVTPSKLDYDLQTHIQHRVEEACHAYGLITGPIHAELRIDSKQEAWILEVANRSIGGDCARTLDYQEPYALEKLILLLAVGELATTSPASGASGVMMIPMAKPGILQRINGVEEAERVTGISSVKVNINPGNELIPLPEGNQYLGYIFARAKTANEVIVALNKAFSEIEFKVMPKIDLTPGITP